MKCFKFGFRHEVSSLFLICATRKEPTHSFCFRKTVIGLWSNCSLVSKFFFFLGRPQTFHSNEAEPYKIFRCTFCRMRKLSTHTHTGFEAECGCLPNRNPQWLRQINNIKKRWAQAKRKKQFSCYNIESKRMWIQHTIVKKKSGYGFYSNQFESSVEKAYTNFFFLSVSMLYLDFLVVHINISCLFSLQHHLASHPIDTRKTSQKTSQQRTRQQM